MRRFPKVLMAVALLAATGCSASVQVNTNDEDKNWDKDGGEWEEAKAPGPPAAEPGMPYATFPGFRIIETGETLVLLEVSRPVEVETKHSPGVLVYRLKDTRAPEKVNQLPLIAHHFPSRVSQVRLRQAGNDLDMLIELRTPAEARHEIIQSEGGMVLEVFVPKWKEALDEAGGTHWDPDKGTYVHDGRDNAE